MSRRETLSFTMLLVPILAGIAVTARADILPPDAKVIHYSYEVENLDAFADKVFVVWPRSCGSDGDPIGTIDLSLNPQWASRMHEVDYEVLAKGKTHEILRYCAHTMRIYALPAAEFPRASRVATADEWTLGIKKDETLAHLPALDAIDLKKRMVFFEKDARVARAPFKFDMVGIGPAASPLKAVHDVIAVEAVEGAAIKVASKRAIYTYEDGSSETRAYATPERPSPSGSGDAGAPAVSTTPATGDAALKDGGTRWVYLAAVAGLIVGGIIAFIQRKRRGA
jgi:hypothetical protein